MKKHEYSRFMGHFNSQPHEEADAKVQIVATDTDISTHSLTRRLTSLHFDSVSELLFQLTASRGG